MRACNEVVGPVFEFDAEHKLVLVVVESTVDSSAVLEIDLTFGRLPLTRLLLVIFKHLCRQKAEVSLLPSLAGRREEDTLAMCMTSSGVSQVNVMHKVSQSNKEKGGHLLVIFCGHVMGGGDLHPRAYSLASLSRNYGE